MTKKQEAQEIEYFERMKYSIIEDVIDGRSLSAIAASIGKPVDLLSKYVKKWGYKDVWGEIEDML